MTLLVPLAFGPGEEFWRGRGAPAELERWLGQLERAAGCTAVVAADSAGLVILNSFRREGALRISLPRESRPRWLPPGGAEALDALFRSSTQVRSGPVIIVNPRLAPLDGDMIRSFIEEGHRGSVPLATVRILRDHPSQVRVHVLIESVSIAHIIEPWPVGLEALPGSRRGAYAATKLFPFNWQVKLAPRLAGGDVCRLRSRAGMPVYEQISPSDASGRFAVFIHESESMARLALPRHWVLGHPLLKKGESAAGLVCPAGRLDRRCCLVSSDASGGLTVRVRLTRNDRASGICVQAKTLSGIHSSLSWATGNRAEESLPALDPDTSGVAVSLFREGGPGESQMDIPLMDSSHSRVTAAGRMMSPDGARECAGRQDLPELLSFDGACFYLPPGTAEIIGDVPKGFVMDDEKSLLVRTALEHMRAAALERAMLDPGESVSGEGNVLPKQH